MPPFAMIIVKALCRHRGEQGVAPAPLLRADRARRMALEVEAVVTGPMSMLLSGLRSAGAAVQNPYAADGSNSAAGLLPNGINVRSTAIPVECCEREAMYPSANNEPF